MKKIILMLALGLMMTGCAAETNEVAEEVAEPRDVDMAEFQKSNEPETITVYKEGEWVEAIVLDEDYVLIDDQQWRLYTEENLGFDPFKYVCEVCGEPDSFSTEAEHRYCIQHYLEACGFDASEWYRNRFTGQVNPYTTKAREPDEYRVYK